MSTTTIEFSGSPTQLNVPGTFEARLDDVSSMTKTLHQIYDQSILVANEDGIRLISAEKAFQVSTFFPASYFQSFRFNRGDKDKITFRFMQREFIESLNLLVICSGGCSSPDNDWQPIQRTVPEQSRTSLICRYEGEGEPLILNLRNNLDMNMESKIMAFSMENETVFAPLAFSPLEEPATIVLRSRKFREYFSGFDLSSHNEVPYINLIMARGDVALKLIARSISLGTVELEIARDDTDIVKTPFVIPESREFNFSYRTQFFSLAMAALKNSDLVKIRCNSSGLLCIEHFHSTDKRIANVGQPGLGGAWNVSSQDTRDILSQFNQPRNKRSSVEYYMLSSVSVNDDVDME